MEQRLTHKEYQDLCIELRESVKDTIKMVRKYMRETDDISIKNAYRMAKSKLENWYKFNRIDTIPDDSHITPAFVEKLTKNHKEYAGHLRALHRIRKREMV